MKIELQLNQRKKTYCKVRFGSAAVRLAYLYILDNDGNIRSVQASFLGSALNATSYRLMEPIGPGLNLDIPPNALLVADWGYKDGGS